MARYRISVQAKRDLVAIWQYVASENMVAADRLIDRLFDTFRTLATQPMMGEDRSTLRNDLRSFGCLRYVIFYDPMPDGMRVIRVIHGSRDVDSMIV